MWVNICTVASNIFSPFSSVSPTDTVLVPTPLPVLLSYIFTVAVEISSPDVQTIKKHKITVIMTAARTLFLTLFFFHSNLISFNIKILHSRPACKLGRRHRPSLNKLILLLLRSHFQKIFFQIPCFFTD